jgi:hypothetical protein
VGADIILNRHEKFYKISSFVIFCSWGQALPLYGASATARAEPLERWEKKKLFFDQKNFQKEKLLALLCATWAYLQPLKQ